MGAGVGAGAGIGTGEGAGAETGAGVGAGAEDCSGATLELLPTSMNVAEGEPEIPFTYFRASKDLVQLESPAKSKSKLALFLIIANPTSVRLNCKSNSSPKPL